MLDFIEKVTGKKKQSASDAKERLKLVLIHDRTDITPGLLLRMKNELIEVISKYVEIDAQCVRIEMEQDGRQQRLVADIPFQPAARKRKR